MLLSTNCYPASACVSIQTKEKLSEIKSWFKAEPDGSGGSVMQYAAIHDYITGLNPN